MKSLRTKVLFSFLATFVGLGIIFSIGLNTYMETNYYKQKIDKMIQAGDQIKSQLRMAKSAENAKEGLDYLGYQFEGRITLLDIRQEGAMIIYENQRYVYNRGNRVREINYGDHTALIINTDYPVANSLWLGYLSQIDQHTFAWLEIPVITINESLDAFRAFTWQALVLGIIISLFVSYWLAKSITDPVAELNQLAKKIGHLDFDTPFYQGKRVDEIGQLGGTLNEITQILKETIENLRIELAKKQQLERLRKRFVAQVSHELQTPISVISSYTEALSDGMAQAEEREEYYCIILDECQKMSKVVKDLLDLSGLESGLTEYKREYLDLEELLQNLIKKQEWILKTEGKEIESYILAANIIADSFRLEQAIGNILSNSIKHAKRRVYVELKLQADNLLLKITNDGDLIEAADVPYIWDSFYKGKNKKAGTGLGLAIASEILKGHGIQYYVYNDNTNKEVVYELIFPGK